MRRALPGISRVLAIAIVVAVALQFPLAAWGIFDGRTGNLPTGSTKLADTTTLDAHRAVGDLIVLLALLLLAAALAAGARGRALRMVAALFALTVVQSVLGGAGASTPLLGALHGLNALAILGLSVHIVIRDRRAAHTAAT